MFHLACCGLTKLPRGNWYCDYCTQKRWDGAALPQRRAKTKCIEANAELSEYEQSNKRYKDNGDDDDDSGGGGSSVGRDEEDEYIDDNNDDDDDDDDNYKVGDGRYGAQKAGERPYKRLKGSGGNEEDDPFDEFRKGHFLRKRTTINYSDAYNTRMMVEDEGNNKRRRRKAISDDDDDDEADEAENERENIRRIQYGLRLRPRKKYFD